jgi:plastocyanin
MPALGLAVAASAAVAQPVLDRSPNMAGTWVTSPRNLFFDISHRFQVVGGDVDVTDIFDGAKILNYPTFLLTYGLLEDINIGFRYSSNSLLAGGPNEWQPYATWGVLRSTGGARPSLAFTGAWNGAAQSVDVELGSQIRFGRFGILGAVRGFSQAFGEPGEDGEAALALAGGAVIGITRYLALAGDVAGRVAGPSGNVAWSAGLQVGIPYTPHTFSLLATNVSSGTLQGTSTGVPGAVYWGFEFTIPFSGFARWGDIFDPDEDSPPTGDAMAPAAVADPGPPPASERRVVELRISGLRYERAELRVPVGTTVRWINRDPVAHTVTADEGAWTSPLIGPGDVFEHTFTSVGETSYHCTPHPFMQGRITVSDGEDTPSSQTPDGR